MTSQGEVEFRRGTATRLVPLAAMFAAATALSHGKESTLQYWGAVAVLVLGAWTTWWAWMTPVISVSSRILTWRDVPYGAGTTIDLDEVSNWEYSVENRRILFKMDAGGTTIIRVGRMRIEDVRALTQLLSRVVACH